MQKIILISVLILIEVCSFFPESKGYFNEIIVITSPEDKSLVEPYLLDVFTEIIHTPQPEQSFILKYYNPWELESLEGNANIIVASLDFPIDSTGDILMDRLLDRHNQDANLLTLGDLYAKNQLLCLIHALDAVAFNKILKENRDWILEEYHALFSKRLKQEVFKNGNNPDLSSEILYILGYTIDLQLDFKLIRSDSLSSFAWVGRGYPYRWITLHKSRKVGYANIDSSWDQLNEDFSMHMPKLIISKFFQKNEITSVGSKKIPVMRGIYEHSESDTGGPFFVYIFDTDRTNEVILVSGFINFPGHEKLLLLRQLEIMAKTLHKGDPA